MSQVIKGLAATGPPLPPLAWTLALGTDIGGNGTPIGASANVVGIAIAEKEGFPISWSRFCKYALPAMILVVGICWLLFSFRVKYPAACGELQNWVTGSNDTSMLASRRFIDSKICKLKAFVFKITLHICLLQLY
jgi:di/tricarboxylate transporter